MAEYVVTARKWRPMVFDDVVGQEHVTATLRNAIRASRLAHAYLFSGPRGVGKTTTARLLAKAVNCLSPRDANPDNECTFCREITEGRSFDVLEIDGASNRGVEEIRNLREAVRYAPARGRYKVYIIDEVHMLTKEAFNALLKTLEEPPERVLFIFATTELQKVPATILSRCQRFDFRRISVDSIIANLRPIAREEGVTIDDDALLLVAKKGDGSLRDAQSLFDQVVSLCGRTVTHDAIVQALHTVDEEMYFRVTDLVRARDVPGALALVDELFRRGHDVKDFLAGLLEHLRNLMIAQTTGGTGLIEAAEHHRKRYAADAAAFSLADLLRLQRLVGAMESSLRWSAQPRFKLEVDLVQMVAMPRAQEVGELLAGIEELKRQGVVVAAAIPPAARERPDRAADPPPPPSPARDRPAAPAPPPPAISEGELSSRWPEFVGEVRKQRISLAALLESATLVGVSGTAVRVGCADEYQVAALTRNREALAEVLRRVFHVAVRIEAEVVRGAGRGAPAAQRGAPPPPAVPAKEEHPVIAAMRRELGAEPVDDEP